MSIIRNRELSQFGSFIYIDNVSQKIGIATEATPFVGIGTPDPVVKLHVVGDTNIEGNLNVINGNLDASSYTLNGNPLVNAEIQYWTFAPGEVDIYRVQGNIGIGTSVSTERLTVNGNISAGQFISTITSGTAPLVVNSTSQVFNLNASLLAGKTPPSGDIVGTEDTQTLTNKTLTSPTISSILNGGVLTLPTGTGTLISTGSLGLITSGMIADLSLVNADIASSAGIVYSKLNLSNSILSTDIAVGTGITYGKLSLTGSITNADIVSNAGIPTSKLAQYTISGTPLGSNLATLTFGTYLTGTSYNGSTVKTIGINASTSGDSNIVARDGSGNFSAGTITATSFVGNGSGLTNLNLTGVGVTNISVTTSSSNSSFKVPFANTTVSTTGNYQLLQDSAETFTYNPSTNTLTAETFSGSLSGNATGLSGSPNITISNLSATGIVSDSYGNLRDIPQNSQSSTYTLQITDAGKHVSITTGGVTVPSSVFFTGDTVTIFNNSSANQTITQGSGVTLRFSGTTLTGNRTLLPYGIATVLCVNSNIFAIVGIVT